jgi:ribulose-5-phosphate 4-epimerase/fuculose-1-phosphate aldolase
MVRLRVSKAFGYLVGIFVASILAFGLSVGRTQAQSGPDPDEANIQDLITASHILANEGVMDSFGHATVRSVKNPAHFFMPRAMPPAQIQRQDIVELDVASCETADHAPIRLNGERFIHCEVYKARPDVQAVIHTHDPAVLPLALGGVPLQPVLAQAGFLPPVTPVFDVRRVPLKKKGMLVLNAALGDALAKSLGNNPVVLMRGHGDTVVGKSIKEATVRAIYTDMDARAEEEALTISDHVIALNKQELDAYDSEQRPDRPWDNFRERLPKQDSAAK